VKLDDWGAISYYFLSNVLHVSGIFNKPLGGDEGPPGDLYLHKPFF